MAEKYHQFTNRQLHRLPDGQLIQIRAKNHEALQVAIERIDATDRTRRETAREIHDWLLGDPKYGHEVMMFVDDNKGRLWIASKIRERFGLDDGDG